jgi:hypothetical protein
MGRPKQIVVVSDPAVPGSAVGYPVADTDQINAIETEQKLEGPDAPVRVLVNCIYGQCNTVVTLTQAQIFMAKQAGLVDDDPAAVAAAQA